jgi:hypothetical protein
MTQIRDQAKFNELNCKNKNQKKKKKNNNTLLFIVVVRGDGKWNIFFLGDFGQFEFSANIKKN